LNGTLRLRVVGSSPAMPRAGGACSSYLIQTGSAAVLVDIGSGAVGKLQLAIDYARLDAIVVSHMHPDHFFDLVPLRYGLKYGRPVPPEKIPLWLPPGGIEVLYSLRKVVPLAPEPHFFDQVFSVREYDPEQAVSVADCRLSFRRTRHYIEAFAIRADCNGRSITYSADTAPCEAVVEHARLSSLFLCEAALGLDTEEGERGHCAAFEAGEMASRAKVERLVLTHYSAAYAPEALVEAAKERFAGPVDVATDGLELTV
jgi:ribonuclease BN (tRNA processing enzyme)